MYMSQFLHQWCKLACSSECLADRHVQMRIARPCSLTCRAVNAAYRASQASAHTHAHMLCFWCALLCIIIGQPFLLMVEYDTWPLVLLLLLLLHCFSGVKTDANSVINVKLAAGEPKVYLPNCRNALYGS